MRYWGRGPPWRGLQVVCHTNSYLRVSAATVSWQSDRENSLQAPFHLVSSHFPNNTASTAAAAAITNRGLCLFRLNNVSFVSTGQINKSLGSWMLPECKANIHWIFGTQHSLGTLEVTWFSIHERSQFPPFGWEQGWCQKNGCPLPKDCCCCDCLHFPTVRRTVNKDICGFRWTAERMKTVGAAD